MSAAVSALPPDLFGVPYIIIEPTGFGEGVLKALLFVFILSFLVFLCLLRT